MKTNQLLKEISQYGFSKEDLKQYSISASTFSNYKRNSTPTKRNSPPVKVLEVLCFALSAIASHPGVNPKKELDQLLLSEGMPMKKYLSLFIKDSVEHLKYTVQIAIESRFKDREAKSAIDTFTEKYKYLNEETLEVATFENPELVRDIVIDDDIRPIARALALYSLGFGAREEYYSFIKGFINHLSPFIRESAFMALSEYYNSDEKRHLELKGFFEQKLQEEKGLGIKKKISILLESMSA